MTQVQGGAAMPPRIKGDKRASDVDRAIFEAIKTRTRTDVAAEYGLTVGQLHVIVERVRRDARGRELLAKDPESLEGLGLIGEIPDPVWTNLHWLNNEWTERPVVMERISDVTGAGRDFIASHLKPKPMAWLDEYLSTKGLAWSANPRIIQRLKPPKPQAAQPQLADQVVQLSQLMRERLQMLERRVAFLEGYTGAVKPNAAYAEGYDSVRRCDHMRDVTPDDSGGDDLEHDGNLICLPGVRLSDVQGERP